MTALLIHRETAIKYARVAHVAAGALLVAAGGIAVYGLPWAGPAQITNSELPPPRSDTAAVATTNPPVSEGVDFTGLSHRLALIDNAPKPAEQAPAETAQAEAPITPAAEQPVRFLGAIIEPTRRVALLFVNGRQRAVLPGQSIRLGADEHAATLKVVSVDDDAVTIEDKGGQRKIEKSVRTGSAVANVAGSVPATPQPPEMPNVDPAMRAARDAARGLDPETRKKFFEEARRARENRPRRDGPNQGNE